MIVSYLVKLHFPLITVNEGWLRGCCVLMLLCLARGLVSSAVSSRIAAHPRMVCSTAQEVAAAAAATIADYGAVAAGYAEGNMNHDVSQNVAALLEPLSDRPAPLDSMRGMIRASIRLHYA